MVIPFLGGCAGYQFGNRSLFPQNVRYVYVPIFESDSLRRDLGERLTEAVVKQIELRTPYKVAGANQADSILRGRITSEDRRILVEDVNDNARQMEGTMRVKVSWTTNRGEQIANPVTVPIPDGYFEITGSNSLVAETGQSVATNQQEMINRLAAQIVSQMEMPW
ncbi:MAG: hypothetical protein K8T25_02215 [Planctomycetia bacterium]|nr:hypothetical protein [Planctomycetia bacterium]